MKLSKKLFKLACKILLADVNYFKLPENLLGDIYKRFCDLNKQLNQESPHILLVISKDQLNKYFQNYQYYSDQNIDFIQIFFLNPLNWTTNIIGDRNRLSKQTINTINDMSRDLSKKAITSNGGYSIVIQNNKNFNVKTLLQHQLIHSIRMIFELMPNKYVNQVQLLKSFKRYFLTDRQFPSLVTDCCNQFGNLNEFHNILKIIKHYENTNILNVCHLFENDIYGQHILFLLMLKKYKKHKYQKAVSFIQEYLKNEN